MKKDCFPVKGKQSFFTFYRRPPKPPREPPRGVPPLLPPPKPPLPKLLRLPPLRWPDRVVGLLRRTVEPLLRGAVYPPLGR